MLRQKNGHSGAAAEGGGAAGFPATEGGGEREEMGRELGGSGGGHGEVGGERERR